MNEQLVNMAEEIVSKLRGECRYATNDLIERKLSQIFLGNERNLFNLVGELGILKSQPNPTRTQVRGICRIVLNSVMPADHKSADKHGILEAAISHALDILTGTLIDEHIQSWCSSSVVSCYFAHATEQPRLTLVEDYLERAQTKPHRGWGPIEPPAEAVEISNPATGEKLVFPFEAERADPPKNRKANRFAPTSTEILERLNRSEAEA